MACIYQPPRYTRVRVLIIGSLFPGFLMVPKEWQYFVWGEQSVWKALQYIREYFERAYGGAKVF